MKRPLVANLALLLLTVGACSTDATHTGTGGATGSGGSAGTGGSDATGGSSSGGSGPTGGTTDPGSGGAATGGKATGGGSAGTGGAGGTGGAATGGMSNSGGSNTGGSGGTGGASTGGAMGGQSGGDLKITSTDFGDFSNAFLITPCQGAGTGHDCPNLPMGMSNCPTASWSYSENGKTVSTSEQTGNTYTEVFTVSGGDPSKTYNVTVHVVGQAEGRAYTGGTAPPAPNPNGNGNNMLYTGGKPSSTHVDYNVFMMTIAPPSGGTAIAGAPTFYAFNATSSSLEGGHYNFALDEMFTFKVKPGFTVTLTSHDSNCIAIKNCGNGGPYNFNSASECEKGARTIDGVTLPTTFRGQSLPNSARQPFQTQFLNFKVMGITAE